MNEEYHKIHSVFKRDMNRRDKALIMWDYARPEFEQLERVDWQFTEKVDGTNIRIIWDGRVEFRGRTDNAQLPAPLVQHLRETFTPERLASVFPDYPATLYGEGYGAGIQRGGVYRQDQSFVLFDVMVGGLWLERGNVEDVAEKLGIDIVPIAATTTLDAAIYLVREGFRSRWGNFIAEGLVGVPVGNFLTRRGERIIVKIKHKDFPPEDLLEADSEGS